ncbi:MAG: BlaI/MecI/CopY family transcriptional regulator [Clostridiales bacterium]|nr:BlaI/MecI/CopY family transcriptional regulator [Clostridiales bacterium]
MNVQCTEAEWKIMEVLWERAPRTMPEITKALQPATNWSRHTVITLLKRMQEKGAVLVDETGPVKTYTPLVKREDAVRSETRRLLNHAFAGRPILLVQTLVDAGEVTEQEMEALLAYIRDNKPRGGS